MLFSFKMAPHLLNSKEFQRTTSLDPPLGRLPVFKELASWWAGRGAKNIIIIGYSLSISRTKGPRPLGAQVKSEMDPDVEHWGRCLRTRLQERGRVRQAGRVETRERRTFRETESSSALWLPAQPCGFQRGLCPLAPGGSWQYLETSWRYK